MESLRRKIKGRCFRKVVIYFLTCCLILNTLLPGALAEVVLQPDGIKNGSITVTPLGGGITQDMTASDGAIGHFSDFDIAAGHVVNCVQSSANANALFRVFSGDGTQILGRFDATGNIYLIDTAGILFGANSQVNVNRLVASGLGMSDTDFNNAVGDLTQPMIFSGGSGDVTNNGTITATDSVYLVGEDVINNGAILCPDGLVVLAAGDTLRLGQPGSSVIVDIGTDLIADGSNDVSNNGTIGVSGLPVGELVLASGDVFSQAIGNVGDLAVVANEDVEFNGDITVTGSVDVLGGQNASSAANIDVHGHITAASIRLKNGADTGPDAVGEQTYSPIVVDDTKNLTATDGDIVVEAVHDILLGGNIEATGDIYLNADEDGHGDPRDPEYSEYPYGGGDVIAHGTLTAGGNIDILANAIRFEANVTAIDGDLTLTGRTSRDSATNTQINKDRWGVIQATDGTTLSAGRNVSIIDGGGGPEDRPPSGTMMLTGEESLAIVAGAADGVDDGQIIVENTAISVVGETSLTLEQDLDIDLGDDQWVFDNQGETDLTLISNNGSVTVVETGGNPEYAADQWASVGATAKMDITLSGNTSNITTKQLTSATGDIDINAEAGQLLANESIEATTGSVNLTAADGIDADGDITAGTNINLNSSTETAGDLLAGIDININDDLTLNGGDWVLTVDEWSWEDGDQSITASTGTVTAGSWIWKETHGELHIYGGNSNLAIDLQHSGYIADEDAAVATAGNLYILGNGDVQISGDITALGGEYWGSPDLPEIQEGETVIEPVAVGGVSIVSENGKIYTEDGVDNDTINVAIEGYSDQSEIIGIDLPYGDGKAAIALMSNGDLKLGEDAELLAKGIYDAASVDDRAAVGFLDEPEEIDGFEREPGLPIDVAVYVQSTEGDIVLAEEADIAVVSVLPEDDGSEYGFILGATVVLDAYDTVSFEGLEEQMFGFDDLDEFRSFLGNLGSYYGYDIDLAGFQNAGNQALINLGYIKNESQFAGWAAENFGLFKDFVTDFFLDYFKDFDFGAYFREHGFRLEGFRLEACSRRTGTLGQAIAEGTLPFADSPWVKEWLLINDYVLRGEGNLDINRAWVLNNNPVLRPEPGAMQPFVPAAPIPERAAFEISGYPALMNWVAKELGIDKGMIQIGMANTLASARDIQPYRTLARLKAAAMVLQDVDGTRVAALAQIISQFASSTAPPTEEQMASIADAIANDIEGNSQYAAAGEYLDALAKYVGILTSEMGFSADESIQFATDNYVAQLAEDENMGVAAYVAARLAALWGS